MITHFIHRMILFCFLFTVIACNVNRGKSVSQGSRMDDTIVYTGCQEKISLKAGSTFEIRMEAISGTGYQWMIKAAVPFLKSLNSDELEFIPPETRENMPGQNGFQVLRFKTLNKGSGEILLEYKRVWEEKAEKSCRIMIEAE